MPCVHGVEYLLDWWGVETLDVKQEINSTLFLYLKTNIMNTLEPPHIGQLIKAELQRQERTVTWLARKLNYSRQNIYHLFNCQWIGTDVLLKICDIMDCNFYKVYSDYWESKKAQNRI